MAEILLFRYAHRLFAKSLDGVDPYFPIFAADGNNHIHHT